MNPECGICWGGGGAPLTPIKFAAACGQTHVLKYKYACAGILACSMVVQKHA
jgi:hypothetical protein